MDLTQENVNQQHNSTQYFEILQELGDCYVSLGHYDQAKKYYEKAAVLAPDESEPYVGIGVVALQQGALDDAQIAFKVACRLNADCGKAYAGLGMVAQEKAEYQQAFEMYLKCLGLDKDNLIAILGLFQTSCKMGTFDKVTHYLEIYLEMHPGDISVMFSLAVLYIKDGRFEESRSVLLKILALDSNHSDAADLLEEVEHSLTKTKQEKLKGDQSKFKFRREQ